MERSNARARALSPELVGQLVSLEEQRFFERQAAERLRMYRALLQGTIRRVSPLTLDLIADAGSSVAAIADGLPVPAEWPWRRLRQGAVGTMLRPRKGYASWAYGPSRFHRMAGCGVVVRDRLHPRGELCFWVSQERLESVACPGGCVLHTSGARGRLHLPARLPDTLLAALSGRPVEQIVSHPALAGRGYVVRKVAPHGLGDGPMIEFDVGLVPLDLPWAAILDELAAVPGSGGSPA